MPVITLTTDFGIKDGFVGTMKGVIWSICPEAQIADISHSIEPQNVLEGAFVLWRTYPFFPRGTIHVAVVDPGVGTERHPLAMQMGDQFFVGPDNGLFTPLYNDAQKNNWRQEIIHLSNERFWLPNVSRTFHGRDIFAPVGAYLAKGIPLRELGTTIKNPVRLTLPKPERTSNGWRAHITVVDVFGNCTTDLPAGEISDMDNVLFQVPGREAIGLMNSYGYKQPGELIALTDSENFIEIAIVNGNAAKVLGLKVGDVIEVSHGKK